MCFSAGASFIGGTLITAVGVTTVVKNHDPDKRLFAAVPLIFGVQQISEGFVWLALQSQGSGLALDLPSYIFLLAAVVTWPSLMPLSVFLMEKSPARRKAISIFLAIGVVTSLYYGAGLLLYNVDPRIDSHHIRYDNDFPRTLADAAFIAYLLATLVPIFISGVRRMWLLGILMTASCLLTGIFYKEYLTSIWCFFAAIISVVILWIITSERTKVAPDNARY